MYIKDTYTGNVRKYGTNQHDSLRISDDGTYLTYKHLQCGDGSIAGDKENSGFLFCDDEGHTPEEDEVLCRYGADAYFNIGGWEEPPKWIPVSERLPEEETDVLICNKNGDIEISRGSYSTEVENDFIWYTSGWRFGKVIAWIDLPKPYKEVKKDDE